MGRCYGQLSLEERIEIYRLHAGGKSQKSIAVSLGRSPSTISRELQRNAKSSKLWPGGYKPARAQQLAERRRRWDCRFKLARQTDLRNHVRKRLAMGHSPEQIAGRLTLEHGRVIISHESIYRFIYHRSAQKDYWHRLLPCRKLRRGHRKRRGGSPASFIKHRRPIGERAAEAEGRTTPGHWEADFMLFARYGQGILVLQEPPAPSTVNLQSFQTNYVEPSASTMEPNLPSITGCTEQSMSKLSSAIRTAPGRRAASKTPSDVCAGRYPAKPTSIPSPKPSSLKSSGISTILRENAWTSKHPPRHSPN
jgi:IS30 family transposase